MGRVGYRGEGAQGTKAAIWSVPGVGSRAVFCHVLGAAVRTPHVLRRLIARAACRVISARDPDFVLPDYLMRWHVLRSRWGCLYIHVITGSDDDRALHDHRSWNVSILLHGAYLEHLQGDVRVRIEGDLVARRAATPHRLQLLDGHALTLFVTGPHQRDWGFVTDDGWVQHERFLAMRAADMPEAA